MTHSTETNIFCDGQNGDCDKLVTTTATHSPNIDDMMADAERHGWKVQLVRRPPHQRTKRQGRLSLKFFCFECAEKEGIQ